MAILFERTVRHTFCLAAVLLTGLSQSAALHGATIEEQFLQQAPRIVAHLRQQGYRNVGVLKFRVKKGNGPVSDSVGTVNTFLAHRLEVALVLASSHDPAQQVGLIRGASATASGIRGAGHTTAQGRQKLFEGRYQPAWGMRIRPSRRTPSSRASCWSVRISGRCGSVFSPSTGRTANSSGSFRCSLPTWMPTC